MYFSPFVAALPRLLYIRLNLREILNKGKYTGQQSEDKLKFMTSPAIISGNLTSTSPGGHGKERHYVLDLVQMAFWFGRFSIKNIIYFGFYIIDFDFILVWFYLPTLTNQIYILSSFNLMVYI